VFLARLHFLSAMFVCTCPVPNKLTCKVGPSKLVNDFSRKCSRRKKVQFGIPQMCRIVMKLCMAIERLKPFKVPVFSLLLWIIFVYIYGEI